MHEPRRDRRGNKMEGKGKGRGGAFGEVGQRVLPPIGNMSKKSGGNNEAKEFLYRGNTE